MNLKSSLFKVISQYRARLILASLFVFLSNGLLILNPLVFREGFRTLYEQTQSAPTWLGHWLGVILGPYHHSIFAWTLLLLVIATVSALFKYHMRMIFLKISREVELNLREKLFEKIQTQSKGFFDRHGIGDLLSRLTNDITSYRDMLGPGLMFPMHFISIMTPALIALFYLSPLMGAISLIPIVAIYLFNAWAKNPMLTISTQVQESLADMSRMVHEHYSGIKLIKSYVVEEETSNLFQSLGEKFSILNMRFVTWQGMFFPALILITKICTLALVVTAAALFLLNFEPGFTTADFLSFMWIQSYLFSPLLMLAWIMPMYQRGKAAYLRLIEIEEAPNEIYTLLPLSPHIPDQATIEFRDLTFTYPNQKKEAISHLNLTIQPGSWVGITGPVGAGKTTLFRLLNREYEVPLGSIFIGNIDIHHYPLEAFHQALVTVEQLPFLFSKTIRENVRFGKEEASEQEIELVTRQAYLHEEILDFPEQYDTIVGERGVSLSGGQKQRVALARAFLVNRSILLLDDVFSAIDASNEKSIFEAMKRNFEGKTVILITHRVSILQQLDRVIYMKNGKIVEDGQPGELASQEWGFYRSLVELQEIEAI